MSAVRIIVRLSEAIEFGARESVGRGKGSGRECSRDTAEDGLEKHFPR